MTDFIKENAEDFHVVVLTVADSLNVRNITDVIMGDVGYLNNFLNATQDRCTDFTFWGGLLSFKLLQYQVKHFVIGVVFQTVHL